MIHDDQIDFRRGNWFESSIVEEIKSLINLPGKTLVLCDGGNKEAEFDLFSQFLKTGDVIMLHDYSHSSEDYEQVMKNTGWKTPAESHFSNIQNAVTKYNLESYHYDMFKNALWGSFIKLWYQQYYNTVH